MSQDKKVADEESAELQNNYIIENADSERVSEIVSKKSTLPSSHQQIYYATDQVTYRYRNKQLNSREIDIHVKDEHGTVVRNELIVISFPKLFVQTVMRMHRPSQFFACCWCADPGSFFSNKISIEAPPGNVVSIRHYVKFGSNENEQNETSENLPEFFSHVSDRVGATAGVSVDLRLRAHKRRRRSEK